MTNLCPVREKNEPVQEYLRRVVEHVPAEILNTPHATLHLNTKHGITIPPDMTILQAASTIGRTPGIDPNSVLEKRLIQDLQTGSTTLNWLSSRAKLVLQHRQPC